MSNDNQFNRVCQRCRQWRCECPQQPLVNSEISALNKAGHLLELIKSQTISYAASQGFVSRETVELLLKAANLEIPTTALKAAVSECLRERKIIDSDAICELILGKIGVALEGHQLNVDTEQLKAAILACAFERQFITETRACEILERKIAESLVSVQTDLNQLSQSLSDFLGLSADLATKAEAKDIASSCITDMLAQSQFITASQSKEQVQQCINEALQGLDERSVIKEFTATCGQNNIVSFVIQQTGEQPITRFLDLQKLVDSLEPEQISFCFAHKPQEIFYPNPSGKVILRSSGFKVSTWLDGSIGAIYDSINDCYTLPYAGPSVNEIGSLIDNALQPLDQLDQCIEAFFTETLDGRVTISIKQRNCELRTASFDLPVVDPGGDAKNQVTNLTATCDESGQVVIALQQLFGLEQTADLDLSKLLPKPDSSIDFCFDHGGPTFTSQNGKITAALAVKVLSYDGFFLAAQKNLVAGCLELPYSGPSTSQIEELAKVQARVCVDEAMQNQDIPSHCLESISLGFSEGVLTVGLEQENCDVDLTASIAISVGNTDETSFVTESSTFDCDENGVAQIQIFQSNASPVSLTADFGKFLDNQDTFPVQQGSSLVCDSETNELLFSLALSSGQSITASADLSKFVLSADQIGCVSVGEEAFDPDLCVSSWSITQPGCPGASLVYDLGGKITAVPVVKADGSTVDSLRVGNKQVLEVGRVKVDPQIVRVFEESPETNCLADCQYAFSFSQDSFYVWQDESLVLVSDPPPIAMLVGTMSARDFACAWIASGKEYCNNYQQTYLHEENVCCMCVKANGPVTFNYSLPSGSEYELDVGVLDDAGNPVGYQTVASGEDYTHNFDSYVGSIKVRFPLCEENEAIVWGTTGDITPSIGCSC